MQETANTILLVIKFISMTLGILFNTIVIVVRGSKFIRHRKISPYHFIILQVAVADFTFALLTAFDVETQMDEWRWKHSLDVCRFVKPMQSVAGTVPGLLMLLLAFERYRGVIKSLTHRLRTRYIAFIAFTIWVVTYCMYLPMQLVLKIYNGGNCHIDYSKWEAWSPNTEKITTLLIFILFWCIPFVGTAFFHFRIYYFVKKHTKQMSIHRQSTTHSDIPFTEKAKVSETSTDTKFLLVDSGEQCNFPIATGENADCTEDENNEVFTLRKDTHALRLSKSFRKFCREGPTFRERVRQRLLSKRSRTNKRKLKIHILMAITISFLICFLPKNLFFLLYAFGMKIRVMSVLTLIHFISAAFLYLHCFINGIIYSLMDLKFRRDALTTLKTIFRKDYRHNVPRNFSTQTRSVQLSSTTGC